MPPVGTDTILVRTNSPSEPLCLEDSTCEILPKGHISLPRTALIASATILIALTFTSTIALGILLFRHHAQRRQAQEAKTWGRKSRYLRRVSMLRKEVDDDFRSRYHGVLVNTVENPEMVGSECGPVELGWEERICEVPNVQVKREKKLPPLPPTLSIPESVRMREGLGGAGSTAQHGRKSLFFCDGVGVWLPKRS